MPAKFECRECGDIFTEKSNLLRHERGHNDKNFHCEICDSRFSRSDALQQHMRSKVHLEKALRQTNSRQSPLPNNRQSVKVTNSARSPAIDPDLSHDTNIRALRRTSARRRDQSPPISTHSSPINLGISLRPSRRLTRQRSSSLDQNHQTFGNGIDSPRSSSVDSIRSSDENTDDFEFDMAETPNRRTSSDLASPHHSTLPSVGSTLESLSSCTLPSLTSKTSDLNSSQTVLTQIVQPSSRSVPTTGDERNESPDSPYKQALVEYKQSRWPQGDKKLMKFRFWQNLTEEVRKDRFFYMMDEDEPAKYKHLSTWLSPDECEIFKKSVEKIEADLKQEFIETKYWVCLMPSERDFVHDQFPRSSNLEDFLRNNRKVPLYREILEIIYHDKMEGLAIKNKMSVSSSSALFADSTTQASASPANSVVQKAPSSSLPEPVMDNLAVSHETEFEEASDEYPVPESSKSTTMSESASPSSEGTDALDSTRSSVSRPTPLALRHLPEEACRNSAIHDTSEPGTVPPNNTRQTMLPSFRDVHRKNDESMNNVPIDSTAKSTVVASREQLRMQSVVTPDKQQGSAKREARPVVHSNGNTLTYLNGDPVEEDVINGNHEGVIQMAIRGRGPALPEFHGRGVTPISFRCHLTEKDVETMRRRDKYIDDNALFVIAFEKTGAYNTNLQEPDQIRLIHPALAHLLQVQDRGGENQLNFERTLLEHEAFTGNSTSRRVAFPMRLPGSPHFVLVMIGLDREDQIWVHILDSLLNVRSRMPIKLITRLAHHYFGSSRNLKIEYGSEEEVEDQGDAPDCGIHTILNLMRYFNESHQFLGPMADTMRITEFFGNRTKNFREEWANRLNQILLVEMPVLHLRFAVDKDKQDGLRDKENALEHFGDSSVPFITGSQHPVNLQSRSLPGAHGSNLSDSQRKCTIKRPVANHVDKPAERESPSKRMKLSERSSLPAYVPSASSDIAANAPVQVFTSVQGNLHLGPSDAEELNNPRTMAPFTKKSSKSKKAKEVPRLTAPHYVISGDRIKLVEGGAIAENEEDLGAVPADEYEQMDKMKNKTREADGDIHIGCQQCLFLTSCLKRPLFWMRNQIYGISEDPYTHKTVPPHLFRVSDEGPKGRGIRAVRDIPTGLVFGPYEGTKTLAKDCVNPDYSWDIVLGEETLSVDGKEKGNWIVLINSPDRKKDANIAAFQHKWEIYYAVIKPIRQGQELTVWYGPAYGRRLAGWRKKAGKERQQQQQ